MTFDERRTQFIYLLLGTALLTALTAYVFYRNYNFPAFSAPYLSDRIKRQQALIDEQQRYAALLDSVHRTIARYRPEVSAVFVEADINNQLDDIRRIYSSRPGEPFFRSFAQVADFYQMMYTDKRVLWSKQTNVALFQKQLDECAVGFQPVVTGPAAPVVPTPTTSGPTPKRP